MKTIIDNNSKLKELYLHWNQIGSEGAKHLFFSLKDNINIKV